VGGEIGRRNGERMSELSWWDKQLLSFVYGENVTVWGPYLCKDGRYRVDVKSDSSPRSTTHQLAKVKLELKLGRRLKNDETVDHIDENSSNDDTGNLQLLLRAENAAKSANPKYLIERTKRLTGTGVLGEPVKGEKNGLAKLTDSEVRSIRERFVLSGELKTLVRTLPINRKSTKAMLEGKTYQAAGGPIVEFVPKQHGSFEVKGVLNKD
jgi:hypothetical protein